MKHASLPRIKWAAAFLLAAVVLGLAIFTPAAERTVVAAPPMQKPTQIPMQQSNTQVALSSSSPTIKAGDSFDLIVTITSDTASRAAQAVLTFNPALVEVTGVSEGDFYQKWAQANGAQTVMVPESPVPDNEKGAVPIVGVSILGSPGNGPTGSGTLMVYHLNAKPGAGGTAEFALSDVVLSDIGDASGRTQALAGVTIQGAAISIGESAAPVAQPTPLPSTQPQVRTAVTVPPPAGTIASPAQVPANANPNQKPEPTVARRAAASADSAPPSPGNQPASTGGSFPWIVVIPVVGVAVLGAVIFMTRRGK